MPLSKLLYRMQTASFQVYKTYSFRFLFLSGLYAIQQTLYDFPIFLHPTSHKKGMISLNPTYTFESPGRLKNLGPMPRDSE